MRRAFLKMTAAGILSLFIPKIERNENMIGDILEKLAQQQLLSQDEIGRLKKWGNQTEKDGIFTSSLQNGQGNININRITSQDAFFQNMPTSYMVMDKQSSTTIAHNTQTDITGYSTYTPVSGDRASFSNDFFELDTTNGRIYIKQTGRMYGFYTYFEWDTNSTGYRAARVRQYHADGTLFNHSMTVRAEAIDGSTTSTNIAFIPWGGTRLIGDYCTLTLYQNSGGNVDCLQCAFGAFVVR